MLNERSEEISALQEEMTDVEMEFEVAKRRLESVDPYYRKFQQI